MRTGGRARAFHGRKPHRQDLGRTPRSRRGTGAAAARRTAQLCAGARVLPRAGWVSGPEERPAPPVPRTPRPTHHDRLRPSPPKAAAQPGRQRKWRYVMSGSAPTASRTRGGRRWLRRRVEMQLPPALHARLLAGPGAAEPLPVERDPSAGAAPFRFAARRVRFPREHEFFEVRGPRKRRAVVGGRGIQQWGRYWAGLRLQAEACGCGGGAKAEGGGVRVRGASSCGFLTHMFYRTGTCSGTSTSRTCSRRWRGPPRGPGERLWAAPYHFAPHLTPFWAGPPVPQACPSLVPCHRTLCLDHRPNPALLVSPPPSWPVKF